MADLTWGLLIATKDRLEVLKVCVQNAILQSPPPIEVIIADSSAAWQRHAQEIGYLLKDYPDIRFVFEKGALPSLTAQRNQAIALAQSDIVFLIDDDSFMHPDCAAQVLKIYSADDKNEVAGVQASLSDEIPTAASFTEARKKMGTRFQTQKKQRSEGALRRWLRTKIFLMSASELFIPYHGHLTLRQIPQSLQLHDVVGEYLFHGCRMTFRREVISETLFDDGLRYYCPGEDLDASYRASQKGHILTAKSAFLHHYTAASGRIDRYKTTRLSALNQAFLLSKYADNRRVARRQYFHLMRRRILAETLKDGLSGRFTFPQLRGLLAAFKEARGMFEMPLEELEDWYPPKQKLIVKT